MHKLLTTKTINAKCSHGGKGPTTDGTDGTDMKDISTQPNRFGAGANEGNREKKRVRKILSEMRDFSLWRYGAPARREALPQPQTTDVSESERWGHKNQKENVFVATSQPFPLS
jgi:hypothetical protein